MNHEQLEISKQNLVQNFKETCAKYPDKKAFEFANTHITYKDLELKSRQFASFLMQNLKLKQGSLVAIMLPNSIAYTISFYALMRAGIIIVNLNNLYTARELRLLLIDSGAKALITLDSFANRLDDIISQTQVNKIIATKQMDAACLGKQNDNFGEKMTSYLQELFTTFSDNKIISLRQAIATGADLDFKEREINAPSPCILHYPSSLKNSTTGVVITHGNLLANLSQLDQAFEKDDLVDDFIVLPFLSFYNLFAISYSLLFFLLKGKTTQIVNKENFSDLKLKETKKYILIANSSFYLTIKKSLPKVELNLLNFAISCGRSTSSNLPKFWQQLSKKELYISYGFPEASPVISLSKTKLKNSAGKLLNQTQVKLVKNEMGEDILYFKGPQMTNLYYKDHKIIKEDNNQDWINSYDIAKIIDNELFIEKSNPNIAIIRGFVVYPSEIKSVINLHAKINSCEILVKTSPNNEQSIIANIKADESLAQDDVIKFCKSYLSEHKLPSEINFIEAKVN